MSSGGMVPDSVLNKLPDGVRESASIQMQIRRNAEDVHGMISDVSSWSKQLNALDVALMSESSPLQGGEGSSVVDSSSSSFAADPPIRGRAISAHMNNLPSSSSAVQKKVVVKKKKKVKRKDVKRWNDAEGRQKASAAGHTYDYFRDKWDKFDYDAAMQNSEDEDGEEEEVEEVTPPKKRPAAKISPKSSPKKKKVTTTTFTAIPGDADYKYDTDDEEEEEED